MDDDDDDKVTDPAEPEEPKTEEDWLQMSNDQLKAAVDKDSHNRKESLKNLRFSWGMDRWDTNDAALRKIDKRPIMDFDLINKNISRAIGDARQNRVTGKVRAADDKADANVARIREGLIAAIQHDSSADKIYDYGFEMLYRGAYAAWEVRTRRCEDNPWQQEAYLKRIANPNQVYMDADAEDENKTDAMHGFKLTKMSIKAFKRKFPKAEHTPDNTSLKTGSGLSSEMYWDKDAVTVADKYEIHLKKEEVCLLSDGRVLPTEEAEKAVKEWEDKRKATIIGSLMSKPVLHAQKGAMSQGKPMPGMPPGAAQLPQGQPGAIPPMPGPAQAPEIGTSPGAPSMPPMGQPPQEETTVPPDEEKLTIVDRMETKRRTVRHYIMSAYEIFSKNGVKGEPFPGRHIPLIVAQGPEINIEGKAYNRSGIKYAIDPQLNYNYWQVGAAEQTVLGAKNPWVMTALQAEGYEGDYAAFPTKNYPIAFYNRDIDPETKTEAVKPTREPTPNPPQGMFTMIQDCRQAVEDGMGMGMRDTQSGGAPGASGKAIQEEHKPSELGNYEFFDNIVRAIVHTMRVLNDIISEIYDTDRDIKFRAGDNTEMHVPINTTVGKALDRVRKNPEKYRGKDVGLTVQRLTVLQRKYGEDHPFNDLTTGKYEINYSTGASYATQRTEALDWWLKYANIDKRVPAAMGDLIVGAHDDIFAAEGARRLKKLAPPGLIEPEAGEQLAKPLEPSPQVKLMMAKAQTEAAKQKTQAMAMQAKILEGKLKLVQYYKETRESDHGIRMQIINILTELTGSRQGAQNAVE